MNTKSNKCTDREDDQRKTLKNKFSFLSSKTTFYNASCLVSGHFDLLKDIYIYFPLSSHSL